jgi:hypothetical protein
MQKFLYMAPLDSANWGPLAGGFRPEPGFGRPSGTAVPSPVQTQGFTLGYFRATLREGTARLGDHGTAGVRERAGWGRMVGYAELEGRGRPVRDQFGVISV